MHYADPRSEARVLVSMPRAMLRDAHMLARLNDVTFAEQMRRMVTDAVAQLVTARPEVARSFKGTLV